MFLRAQRPSIPSSAGSVKKPGEPRIVTRAFDLGTTSATTTPAAHDPATEPLRAAGGKPLPAAFRREMESRFEADFSAVRVYQDRHAERLGADAFTAGERLHFAPGRYAPASSFGRELIAHELAHVLQQRAGRVRRSAHATGVEDAGLEGEAEAVGRRIVAGGSVSLPGGSAGPAAGTSGPAPPIQCRKTIVNGKIVEVPDDTPPRPFVPFSGVGRRLRDGQPIHPTGLRDLPDELHQHILGFTGMQERGRFAQTSQRGLANVQALNRRDPMARLALINANLQGRVPENVWNRESIRSRIFTLGDSDEEEEKEEKKE